jgi:hypothetical protein
MLKITISVLKRNIEQWNSTETILGRVSILFVVLEKINVVLMTT